MTTGARIKARRKELGLSAEEIAKELSVSAATIYRYEKGDIEKLPGYILEPLSKILHTTPAYLMGWEDEAEQTEKPAFISESELDLAIFNLIKQLPADEKAREIAYLRERIGVLDK